MATGLSDAKILRDMVSRTGAGDAEKAEGIRQKVEEAARIALVRTELSLVQFPCLIDKTALLILESEEGF
jgi:hypothetical protein